MKKVSEVENFPFLSKELCYYEVLQSDLKELARREDLLKDAFKRAKIGESRIFVSWHGNYRTDMFEVDDLSLFGQAFGFEPQKHIHDIEWKYSDFEKKSSYVSLNLVFKCGCTFDDADGINRMKRDLLLQKGWDMSGSYMGGYNSSYTIRVRKSTIKE